MTRIISYNVNGIRSAMNKGLTDWLNASKPDVFCLQELKAQEGQINLEPFNQMGYHHYWHQAQKKGYSGVAILSKQKPKHVEIGCGMPEYDNEGRVIRADFEGFSVMSVYLPSGTSGDERQAFKIKCLSDFDKYILNIRKQHPNLIICGDYNICHKPIDIHDPIRNKNSSGFLPEERDWLEQFIQSGFIDSFRYFDSRPHQYTWWSQRANSRAKNLGWRIDYQMISEGLKSKLKDAKIFPEAKHSDHCPTMVEMDF